MARKSAEARRKEREKLKEYKRRLRCIDCGYSFRSHPECCDFHHRDPATKSFNVSDSFNRDWPTLKREIAKCDALCANCHRIRHARHDS